MGDWLKDKPFTQMVLNMMLSLLAMLFMFYLSGWTNSSIDVSKDIENLKLRKADYEYVDKANQIQDARLETTRVEIKEDIRELRNDIKDFQKTQLEMLRILQNK